MSASHVRVTPALDHLAELRVRPGGWPGIFAVARKQPAPAVQALHILIDTLEAMATWDLPLLAGLCWLASCRICAG